MRFECHQPAAFENIFNFKEMKEADNQIADRGHDPWRIPGADL